MQSHESMNVALCLIEDGGWRVGKSWVNGRVLITFAPSCKRRYKLRKLASFW